MNTAQFKNWLEEKIAWIQQFPSVEWNESNHLEVRGFINEAYDYAVDLRLPEAADACRQGPVTIRLLECLNAIPEPPKRSVYNMTQAGERLGVHRRTVGRLIDAGELECTRIGTRVTITKEQLEDYQESEADSESLFG